MTREELLLSRGFRTEKELETFLENCEDESWKTELIEFYGEKSDKKSSEKKNVKETEVEETPVEEVVEETTDKIVTDEIVTE